jgi:Mg2+ and Co2+ transporter CorA
LFVQFILSLAITLFLLNRLRSQRVPSLLLVTISFAPITVLTGLLVMNAGFLPFYRLLTAYAENTVLALAMVALFLWLSQSPLMPCAEDGD